MKCKVPTETPNTITQTSLQEVFMKKIEIQMQRSKKRTMTVEAGFYSKKDMKEVLGWTSPGSYSASSASCHTKRQREAAGEIV